MAADALAIVGLIRNAQGIRGEVVVEPLTDAPDAVFASGRRVFAGAAAGKPRGEDKPLTVRAARPFKGGVMVKFEEVPDGTPPSCCEDATCSLHSMSSRRHARTRSTSTISSE